MIAFLFFFLSTKLFAAACCSSTSSIPAFITDESFAQTTFSTALSNTIGDSHDDGSSIFFNDSHSEETLRLTLSQSYAFAERWQVFASLQGLRNAKELDGAGDSNWALADTNFGAAYEIVPEYTYHPLKPRVFGIASITAPTGKPADQSASALQTDASGLGAWGFTLGAHVLKVWTDWDTSLTASHTRYAPSERIIGIESVNYTPGALTTAQLAVGRHAVIERLPARFGVFAGPEWQAPSSTASTGSRLVWNVGATAALTLSDRWAALLSYNDQTLAGPTYNASLARSAALQLTRSFAE